MNQISILGLLALLFVVWFTYRQAFHRDQGNGQSKRQSVIEAWTNICIGFSINFIANLWLIPMMTGAHLSAGANFWGGWVYTSISILRQYAIRRWFNERIVSAAQRLAR